MRPLKPEDESFYDDLVKRLPEGAVVPLFFNDDGTLNRQSILSLPCFSDSQPKVGQ